MRETTQSAGVGPLALAAWMGDPTSPACWSGTPFNLITAFQQAGVEMLPVSTQLPRWLLAPALLASYGRGRVFEPTRSALTRAAYQMLLSRRLRESGARAVLHTGELDLPFHPDGRRHYLFVDSTLDLYLHNPEKPWLRHLPGRKDAERATARGFAQVDHFFAIADYVARNLIDHYRIAPEKVTVVGTGRGKIEPLTGDKDFANGPVLFVAKGRVREKGGFLLVEAFRRLRAAGCDAPLVIVGATDLRDAIAGLRNVELHGFVPWETLQSLFHRAVLFAMPALHEPWGLVYLEALAARTPILGLPRNSFPEISGQGAFGFAARDGSPAAVADALLDALSDRARLERMGAAGQAHCLSHYSWQRTVSLMIERMAA